MISAGHWVKCYLCYIYIAEIVLMHTGSLIGGRYRHRYLCMMGNVHANLNKIPENSCSSNIGPPYTHIDGCNAGIDDKCE